MDGALGPDGLKTAIVASEDALDDARFGFARAQPRRSAHRTFHFMQLAVIGALVAAYLWAARTAPQITFVAFHITALAIFSLSIFVRSVAAGPFAPLLTRLAAPARYPTYTILCPLYREANVVPDLIISLACIDYPVEALDIKLLVESDDPETITAARTASSGMSHVEVIIIPAGAPRTKPKALNVGLSRARGDFVVVYDAEDRPHPQQLLAALAAFEDDDATLACVQAPLEIDNADVSWISGQFAAEYAIQFREMLPLLAHFRLPLPLGGTSNHFRTSVLRESGGWDAYNVTEDADLGYRLARDGFHIGVIGPPTYEEAPITFGAWFNQRTRWIKGHLQTWLILMRNPVRTAQEMGLASFAAMQFTFASGILAAFVHGPLAFILLTALLTPYDLLTPADLILAILGYSVAMFASLIACGLSNTFSHARAALTMPLYWPLASLAAYRALIELIFLPHYWSKTKHGLSARTPPDLSYPAPPIEEDRARAA